MKHFERQLNYFLKEKCKNSLTVNERQPEGSDL